MTDPTPRRRKALSKLQRVTAAGAELIALCQTITEDGRLVEEEVAALRQWLAENDGTPLPAIEFLRETVERVVADGKITSVELQEVYAAIETVLPRDIRATVRGSRVAVERAASEAARDAWAKVSRWDFMVAGVRYEGRAAVIRQFARPDDQVFLIRDRFNEHSRNAVEVCLSNGKRAGYVPEDYAIELAPLLDSGYQPRAHIKKILWTRQRAPIPVVIAFIHPPDAVLDAPRATATIPANVSTTSAVPAASVAVDLASVGVARNPPPAVTPAPPPRPVVDQKGRFYGGCALVAIVFFLLTALSAMCPR